MQRGVLVVAVVCTILSVLYVLEDLRYPMGTAATPGPGLFPLLVGAFLFLCSLLTCYEAVSDKIHQAVDWPDSAGRSRMLLILTATFCYIVFLNYVGHAVAAAMVTLVVMQAMGHRGWLTKLFVAILAGPGSYYIFTVLLGYPLPGGTWFGQ